MITEASSTLYTATRQRAFIGSVQILIPQTWDMGRAGYIRSTWESYEVFGFVLINFQ